MTPRKPRCVNYDWVEVFCVEDAAFPPRTAEYYAQRYEVDVREYGTPMYAEMFVLRNGRHRLLEVRRNPFSKVSEGGIFPDSSCHIRLTNRMCYHPDPIGFLIAFLKANRLTYCSTKRLDICLDFNRFDNGDDPAAFLRKYQARKYSKMYQREFSDHGEDRWSSRDYNSIKFGAPSSPITTKIYNKTRELHDRGDKPHIREAWRNCGLDTDADVWRAEFSIYPNFRNLVKTDTGQQMPVDIMQYRTRPQILELFFMLADRYLDFRYVETMPGHPEKLQRKDRCRRKVLFKYDPTLAGYKPQGDPDARKPVDKTIFKLVDKLSELAQECHTASELEAVDKTARMLIDTYAVDDFHKSWVRERLRLSLENKWLTVDWDR